MTNYCAYSDVSNITLSSESLSPALLPALSFLRWKRGVPKNEFLIVESFERHGPLGDATFAALPPEANELDDEAADPITEFTESVVNASWVIFDCRLTAEGPSRREMTLRVAAASAAASTG